MLAKGLDEDIKRPTKVECFEFVLFVSFSSFSCAIAFNFRFFTVGLYQCLPVLTVIFSFGLTYLITRILITRRPCRIDQNCDRSES